MYDFYAPPNPSWDGDLHAHSGTFEYLGYFRSCWGLQGNLSWKSSCFTKFSPANERRARENFVNQLLIFEFWRHIETALVCYCIICISRGWTATGRRAQATAARRTVEAASPCSNADYTARGALKTTLCRAAGGMCGRA